MTEQETRDIAVEARTLTKSHIEDCVRFRQILADTAENTDKKIDALGDKITGLQVKAAYALGALIVAGKGLEILVGWFHK